jgi:hypothetical protein
MINSAKRLNISAEIMSATCELMDIFQSIEMAGVYQALLNTTMRDLLTSRKSPGRCQ